MRVGLFDRPSRVSSLVYVSQVPTALYDEGVESTTLWAVFDVANVPDRIWRARRRRTNQKDRVTHIQNAALSPLLLYPTARGEPRIKPPYGQTSKRQRSSSLQHFTPRVGIEHFDTHHPC